MKFTKMQGAGNDFVMLETGENQQDWAQTAIDMCDRHYGVGADSLILILPSDKADFKMRIFDADGSEAEICGNGIRCLAKYVFDHNLITADRSQISVETLAGIRNIKLDITNGIISNIQAGMGTPVLLPDKVPVNLGTPNGKTVDIKGMSSLTVNVNDTRFLLNFVSMGNPHAVHFIDIPVSDFPLAEIGPQVENMDIFPNRTNFEIARVLNRNKIEVRVWERGVGETLACGSGACAVTVAAQLHEYIDSSVDIVLPGGILQTQWDGTGEVMMSGPAETVFTGEWPD